MPAHKIPIRERFDMHTCAGPNGCWIWTASTRSTGYGQIKIKGKNKSAHRVSYEEYIGPIPKGLCVCHTCDTPLCINPKHLFLGTNSDNMKDMVAKGRQRDQYGGKHAMAVYLTDNQIKEILDTPKRTKGLSARIGVAIHMIQKVRNGTYWRLTDVES